LTALQQGGLRIPESWWLSPIDLAAEPHRLTRLPLNSLAADPEACHAALDRAPLSCLRTVERPITNGCGLFNVVPGPAYNEAHDDHVHLDMGHLRSCR